MKSSLLVAVVIALIGNSVTAGVKFTVESTLLDERLSSELQKAVKPVYVHTDDSVINLRGWVTPQITLAPLRFQESSSSAIADLSFSGQVRFSSLRLKCLLQDRTVGGRIGFSGTARVMVTGERIALCCFSVNPQVQCLASDSPFLRFLFKRNAIREAIQKAIRKQAAIAAQSFVRTANEEFTTLADSLKKQLQQQIPALNDKRVQMAVQSGSGFASLLMSHSNTDEKVEVRIGSENFAGLPNGHTVAAKIWDENGLRFSTIQVNEECLNRLYRIAIGKKTDERYTTNKMFVEKKATVMLNDSSPFLLSGDTTKAEVKMVFESVGDISDCWLRFKLHQDTEDKDHILTISEDKRVSKVLPKPLNEFKTKTNNGKITGLGDLSATAHWILGMGKSNDWVQKWNKSLVELSKSNSYLLEESYIEEAKTVSLKFQWTQLP